MQPSEMSANAPAGSPPLVLGGDARQCIVSHQYLLRCDATFLIEPNDAEHASRRVTEENRDPNVERIERARLLNHETDAQRHDDLRGDRDVERALCIARPLKAASTSARPQ